MWHFPGTTPPTNNWDDYKNTDFWAILYYQSISMKNKNNKEINQISHQIDDLSTS